MGFRCPNCHKDFGFDENKFKKHLKEDGECSAIAHLNLLQVDIASGKKKLKHKEKKSVKRKRYELIDPNHNFVKVNIVSEDSMWDNIECSKCGLKGKRLFSQYKFDGRISYKRIEKCGRNK